MLVANRAVVEDLVIVKLLFQMSQVRRIVCHAYQASISTLKECQRVKNVRSNNSIRIPVVDIVCIALQHKLVENQDAMVVILVNTKKKLVPKIFVEIVPRVGTMMHKI